MLSRTAENLYWLGRYLERAENVARMVDVEYHAGVEAGPAAGPERNIWEALIATTGARDEYARLSEASHERGGLAPGDFLVFAVDNPNSIRSIVTRARGLALELREFISREVWLEVNALYLVLARRRILEQAEIYDICTNIKRSIETVFGLYDNTVLFEEGREWFRTGIYLERADMTSRILDAKYHILLESPSEVGGALDRFQWAAILRSASAWEAFRKTIRDAPTGPHVAEFLVHNAQFPRSLAFCVMAMLRHYGNATAASPVRMRTPAGREMTLLQIDLSAHPIDEIIEGGLHEFLDGFQERLIAIDRLMQDNLFRTLPESVA